MLYAYQVNSAPKDSQKLLKRSKIEQAGLKCLSYLHKYFLSLILCVYMHIIVSVFISTLLVG